MVEHANTHYDPDWAGRITTAEAYYVRAQMLCDAAMATGFGSPAHRAALDRLAAAKDELRAARLSQFHSIAEYAAWRFSTLEDAEDGFALIPDFRELTSVAEVDDAYERASRHRREGSLEGKSRLQTGQPPGLAAFAEETTVISTWRRFGPVDTGIECMVTFHETAGRYHICLAHAWGGLRHNSNEIFRRIATQLARESIMLLRPAAAPVFRPDGHRQAQNRDLIREVNALAANFQFYRHLLPDQGLREQFSRVDMGWDGASFYDPDWSAMVYPTLPEVLRAAAATPAPMQLAHGTAVLAPDGSPHFHPPPNPGRLGANPQGNPP
jgi:hypothetical protein